MAWDHSYSSYIGIAVASWNVMAHAQKSALVFRAKRTSPFISAGGRQFSRLLAAEVCGISGSNAGYTVFRGSVKGNGYPLQSPVSPLHFPARASPRAITFQLDSTILFKNIQTWRVWLLIMITKMARTGTCGGYDLTILGVVISYCCSAAIWFCHVVFYA